MVQRVVYIGNNISSITSGADVVNKRNLTHLQEIFGLENIKIFELYSNTIFEKIKGFIAGTNERLEREIIEFLCSNSEYTIVFFSNSLFGHLAKRIKDNCAKEIKIYTFFHNIEKNYAKSYVKTSGLLRYPFYIWAMLNEKMVVKYSDTVIFLNERDRVDFYANYPFNGKDSIIPVSYVDKFNIDRSINTSYMKSIYLFVGVAFFANIHAIEWFIEKVLPYVDGNLVVVGKGMDCLKEKYGNNKRINVYGFVDDLDLYYYQASLVIAPIFVGAGMKTKIAEALMYGKTVVGTKEAFTGYVQCDSGLVQADTAQEFINILTSQSFRTFNQYSRECFINNYSYTASRKLFLEIMEEE